MAMQFQDLAFLELCEIAKKGSHDPTRPVGAVLTSPSGQVIATGTNRPPPETNMTLDESIAAFRADPQLRYYFLEHAERDALSNARLTSKLTAGATAYASLFPCADCARALIAAGVKRVVAPLPLRGIEENRKWELHFIHAKELFRMSKVQLDLFTPEALAAVRRAQQEVSLA